MICQYGGGFTDYQRKKEAKAEAAGHADTGKTAMEKPAAKYERAREKKLKFTYAEQRDWDTIEADMAALEGKLADLDSQIAEAATSYDRLNKLMTEKEEAEALLEEKMERWMYLNELAEKIAAQK